MPMASKWRQSPWGTFYKSVERLDTKSCRHCFAVKLLDCNKRIVVAITTVDLSFKIILIKLVKRYGYNTLPTIVCGNKSPDSLNLLVRVRTIAWIALRDRRHSAGQSFLQHWHTLAGALANAHNVSRFPKRNAQFSVCQISVAGVLPVHQ